MTPALAGLLLQFALGAALIARAGCVLSRSVDALAEAHGWGRGWVAARGNAMTAEGFDPRGCGVHARRCPAAAGRDAGRTRCTARTTR
jgi:hypothetical protein